MLPSFEDALLTIRSYRLSPIVAFTLGVVVVVVAIEFAVRPRDPAQAASATRGLGRDSLSPGAEVDRPIDAPSHPVGPPPSAPPVSDFAPGSAAFRAPRDGASCPVGSTLFEGVCVHDSVRSSQSDEALRASVLAYQRGAAPPVVGGVASADVAATAAIVPREGVPIFTARVDGRCSAGYVPFEDECAHRAAYREREDGPMLRRFVEFYRNTGISPNIVVGTAPSDGGSDRIGPSVTSSERSDEAEGSRERESDESDSYLSDRTMGRRIERRIERAFDTSGSERCRRARSQLGIVERNRILVTPSERERQRAVRSNAMLGQVRGIVEAACRDVR